MKMYAISDNDDTSTGLRLAGIESSLVHTKEDTKRELDKVLADKDVGILIITEKTSKLCKEYINDIKLNRQTPLVVEVPDRHGFGREPNFITNYINEAIGVKLS